MTVVTPPEWVEQRFREHYVVWRDARIAAIRAHYGDAFFRDRTLLELGCGYGDIGAAFVELGAKVTCCDVREEHLAVVRDRWPCIVTVRADLNHEWPFGRFDIILHLGLLYHLEPSHRSLFQSCRSTDHLVVETEVCDSSSPDAIVTATEDGYDQAVDGAGCRPSAARVERVFAVEGLVCERVTDDRCNAGYHIYDWADRNSGRAERGQRRFWFVRRVPS
jgi:SAM-dependent methyltransferase